MPGGPHGGGPSKPLRWRGDLRVARIGGATSVSPAHCPFLAAGGTLTLNPGPVTTDVAAKIVPLQR